MINNKEYALEMDTCNYMKRPIEPPANQLSL